MHHPRISGPPVQSPGHWFEYPVPRSGPTSVLRVSGGRIEQNATSDLSLQGGGERARRARHGVELRGGPRQRGQVHAGGAGGELAALPVRREARHALLRLGRFAGAGALILISY